MLRVPNFGGNGIHWWRKTTANEANTFMLYIEGKTRLKCAYCRRKARSIELSHL